MAGGVLCVLFTDLVGSTELMARLGDTAFDRVRGEHFVALRDAFGENGVEVKNTGDGLLATFTSAAEALGAAVRIQQSTDRQGRSLGVPMAVRVGLALGEVSLEDGDVFGTPVVEAARLVATARPGQILTTTLVRAVAGTRAGVSFVDLGSLELKGLPDPVPVCEVGWEPLAVDGPAAAVALPGLLLRTGRIFVGRDAELDRLRSRWKDATTANRSLVLLGGEPGIGKTRLAAALATELHGQGATVLAGRCDEDMGVPYQPFVEALRHYASQAPAPLRLGRHAGELVRLIPELLELVPGLPEPLRSDPETERYRLFDAIAAWLADLSSDAPVLLVLDDLQWAAKPTLLLLRHILRSDDGMRLLIVATYRDTETAAGDPFGDFLTDLPRVAATERLPVSGLDAVAVAAFVEAAAGHRLDDDGAALAEAVWRETEGNCFFVAEVLRHLAESGALEERNGRWSTTAGMASVPIPEGVRDVVTRRLSRLPGGTNPVLAAAAVAGLEFDPAVVGAAGGFAEDAVLTALEAAIGARLVVEVPGPVPRNRFAHALVRSTLYDELSAGRRQSLHRRTAEALEMIQLNQLDDHLPALAHHWSQAGVAAKALDYAHRAGDRASVQLAHDDAARFYRQSLKLLDGSDPRYLDLLISLGEAQRRAGDPAFRETLLDAARQAQKHGDAKALARAALANSRFAFMAAVGSVDTDLVWALEAALSALGGADPALRARVLANLARELSFEHRRERRTRLSDEAVALAHQSGDQATLADVLIGRFYAIFSPATLEERLADTALLVEVTEELADPFRMFSAHYLRCRVLLEAAEPGRSADHQARAERLAGELGQATPRWFVSLLRVSPPFLAGRLEEANRLSEEMVLLGRATGQPDADLMYVGQQTQIAFQQGRLGDLVTVIEEHHRAVPTLRVLSCLLALAYVEAGRPDEARPLVEELAADSFDLTEGVTGIWALMCLAEVAQAVGERRWAATLYERLQPYGPVLSVNAGLVNGCVDYHLGVLATMLERYAEADAHFSAVARLFERMSVPVHLGRTRAEWARMRLSRRGPGDVEEARRLLAQALTAAVDLGLPIVERQARTVMELLP